MSNFARPKSAVSRENEYTSHGISICVSIEHMASYRAVCCYPWLTRYWNTAMQQEARRMLGDVNTLEMNSIEREFSTLRSRCSTRLQCR
jgi:hypothetical protein